MAADARDVVRRLIEEGFNEGNLEVVDALTSPALVEHQNFGPDHAPGAEGVRAVVESLRRAFSDFQLAIEDLAAAGDTVWLRMVATGTNDGSFMGNAPTGRPMRIDVFDVIRVEDGRMVEHWGVPDRLGALLQLGLMGPPRRSHGGLDCQSFSVRGTRRLLRDALDRAHADALVETDGRRVLRLHLELDARRAPRLERPEGESQQASPKPWRRQLSCTTMSLTKALVQQIAAAARSSPTSTSKHSSGSNSLSPVSAGSQTSKASTLPPPLR